MKIIVLDYEKQLLQLEFTDTELQHPLFSSALSRLRNIDELEVHKSGEEVKVECITLDIYQTTGVLVDQVRDLFKGDVVFEYATETVEVSPAVYDDQGNLVQEAVTQEVQVQLPKDLSKCPCFGFTPEPVPEPEVDPEQEVEDESGIQEPVSELDKSTL